MFWEPFENRPIIEAVNCKTLHDWDEWLFCYIMFVCLCMPYVTANITAFGLLTLSVAALFTILCILWVIQFSVYVILLQLKGTRNFQTSAAVCSDNLFVHRDTPEDNPTIPFEFTPDNQKVRLTESVCELFRYNCPCISICSVPMLFSASIRWVTSVLLWSHY